MSHVTEVKVRLEDLDALALAARRLGGELVRDQKTFQSFGGSRPPCHHALRFEGCSYEVGVLVGGDGKLTLRCDFWSSGGLNAKLGGERAPKLMQAYAVERARAQVVRGRKHVILGEKVLADGTIRLQLQQR